MKGVIAICLNEVIVKKFGEESWRKVLKTAGLPGTTRFFPSEDVEDAAVMAVFKATCSVLNLSSSEAAGVFGDHWCCEYAPRLYGAYFKGAKDAKEFLKRMGDVHKQVTATIPKAHPPAFAFEEPAPNKLVMRYISSRGLGDIFVGVVKGVGRHFKEELDIRRIGPSAVEITFAR